MRPAMSHKIPCARSRAYAERNAQGDKTIILYAPDDLLRLAIEDRLAEEMSRIDKTVRKIIAGA